MLVSMLVVSGVLLLMSIGVCWCVCWVVLLSLLVSLLVLLYVLDLVDQWVPLGVKEPHITSPGQFKVECENPRLWPNIRTIEHTPTQHHHTTQQKIHGSILSYLMTDVSFTDVSHINKTPTSHQLVISLFCMCCILMLMMCLCWCVCVGELDRWSTDFVGENNRCERLRRRNHLQHNYHHQIDLVYSNK